MTEPTWEIRQGDVLDQLREMPNASVHCCVTSPPYWGLRDYGTAEWEGGDPECDHVGQEARTVSGGAGKQYTNAGSNRVYSGDCRCGATRKDRQLGLEPTPEEYVARLVEVFREVRRVLRDDGTLWLNLGDSYAAGASAGRGDPTKSTLTGGGGRYRDGSKHEAMYQTAAPVPREHSGTGVKHKDLVGIPWRVAFALQADGWYLRSDIIWAKPNPMPESVRDRPTKAHEYVFLLPKSERYFYDADAIAEATAYVVPEDRQPSGLYSVGSGRNDGGVHRSGGFVTGATRNRRSVWTITTKPYPEAHFATFPPELPELCIKAGCPVGGVVLDPFSGAGTTGLIAVTLERSYIGIELNPQYAEMSKRRIMTETWRADAGGWQ
ncbi:MAG TPA: site-specific DNA-methyltransferase, partial [Bryobacteraceae bacterium]|nr:site-specific DNA-methyltransferase [Bryobacteraceae bacterium]